MSDAAAPVQVTKTKKTPTKAKKPAKTSTHPTCAVMVVKAIKEQKERNGSSLQAIKKYIADNYKGVDVAKLSFHIKAALKRGVEKKTLIQTKGTGASGRFKVAVAAKAEKPKKVTKPKKSTPKKPEAAKKPAAKKTPKKTAAKKATTKKPAAKKPATKKPATKKPAAKKPAAKKPAAKKPAAKKPAPKKAAAK